MTVAARRVAHVVRTPGPAKGMTFSGQLRLPEQTRGRDVPLVVALHGGGYTSSYFDVPGYSLLDRAEAAGVPVLALDRPSYGGTSAVPLEGSVFAANAAALAHAIGELWDLLGEGLAGVVLIAHSIGVPIAMSIAAARPRWPLLGIALSGCLLRSPQDLVEVWRAAPGRTLDSPIEGKASRMLGPAWTLRDDMPAASYFPNVPVLTAELIESATGWPDLFRRIAPRITVPVHHRAGAFDVLWDSDPEQLHEFAAALTGSPRVDAAFVPAAGHAIDYHRVGGAFQAEQLAFALSCAAATIEDPARGS